MSAGLSHPPRQAQTTTTALRMAVWPRSVFFRIAGFINPSRRWSPDPIAATKKNQSPLYCFPPCRYKPPKLPDFGVFGPLLDPGAAELSTLRLRSIETGRTVDNNTPSQDSVAPAGRYWTGGDGVLPQRRGREHGQSAKGGLAGVCKRHSLLLNP